MLSVTTFYTFRREFSRSASGKPPISFGPVDLCKTGIMIGAWLPLPNRRNDMITVCESLFERHKTSAAPLRAGSGVNGSGLVEGTCYRGHYHRRRPSRCHPTAAGSPATSCPAKEVFIGLLRVVLVGDSSLRISRLCHPRNLFLLTSFTIGIVLTLCLLGTRIG